jgi:hydrogenase maturation protein HypF
VRGVVQGVGFRPFVYHLARADSLVGWVLNEPDAVRIEVQGEEPALRRFLAKLRADHPPQASIETMDVCEVPAEAAGEKAGGFEIRTSRARSAPRPTVPADLATCRECLREINDPAERRHRYPFTNCTNCGPRWSIIEQLPYDRPRTSMRGFRMCPLCRAEYEEPGDRRFHAQPIACPACGPGLELLGRDGSRIAAGDQALRRAGQAVLSGQILALKGLGGFQLIADATNEVAVRQLRSRKRRPDKPLAIMLSSLQEVRARCIVSTDEAKTLASPAAPILLLRRRTPPDVDDVAATIAPDNPYLGVMLPYTPLHHLLLGDVARPLACTSGNLSEEPMAICTEDALTRLGGIADLVLTHGRPIVRPVDDSVARLDGDRLQLLRRARGYAPLPIRTAAPLPTILAVGGHLKNTVALSLGSSIIMSPHIGDLDNTLSVDVHRRAIEDLATFFDVRPSAVACDLHPDYASTREAERLAAAWDVPLLRVQHHHAHVAACVAEHGIDEPVLGLSWDGTGYGTDRTVWGGEVLMCEAGRFTRLAHLRTFPLPGGDRAARQPRRSALGVLFEILGEAAADVAREWFAADELPMLIAALRRPKLFPRTSSMGRLFDAVAALCGLWPRVTFEGQAAMALQFAADPDVSEAYPLPLVAGSPAVLDWEPLVHGVIADRGHGVPLGVIAAKFHNALAETAVAAARRGDCRQVVLTGGCFQNAWLTERVRTRLSEDGFNVYTHRGVPPGDGGIALGQILVAAGILGMPDNRSRNRHQQPPPRSRGNT